MSRRADVVVVGAGLAGLSAADRIARAGLEVLVLEARDRVGGRTLTVSPLPGLALDLGAQWVAEGHTVLTALAAELGLPLLEMARPEELTVLAGGERLRLSHEQAEAALGLDEAIAATVARLDALAAEIEPAAPWEHARAAQLDGRTFGSWLEDEVEDAAAHSRLTAAAEGYFAAPPHEVSLLHALVYARANGGFAHLLGPAGDPASQRHLAGGAQGLALGLAARLDGRVLLERAVTSIEERSDRISVRANGESVDAAAAIVAIPPHLTAAISCTPGLPWRRRQLVQRIAMGSGLKMHVVYREPGWRADGASGHLIDLDSGLIAFDASPAGGPGAIVALPTIAESRALAAESPERRRDVLVDRLERALGPSAADPIHYEERMWAWEPASDGEVSIFSCGAWSAFGAALRAPVGRLLFAGTETSPEYMGQMEGALRSGARAAAEALAIASGEPRD